MSLVEFVIPLLPLDRMILDRIKFTDAALAASSIPVSKCVAFRFWSWTFRITALLDVYLDESRVEEDYRSDLSLAYGKFLEYLSSFSSETKAIGTDLYRVIAIQESNPSILTELANRPSPNIKCVPATHDLEYWCLMQSLLGRGELKLFDGIFDIWNLVQVLFVRSRWHQIGLGPYQAIIKHPQFNTFYEFYSESETTEDSEAEDDGSLHKRLLDYVEDRGQAHTRTEHILDEQYGPVNYTPATSEETHRRLRRRALQVEKWSPEISGMDAQGRITSEYLAHVLQRRRSKEDLPNPRDFFHIIPWDELVLKSSEEIALGDEIDDPFEEIIEDNAILGYALWELPSSQWKWHHHLRTEDEALQYCMARDWTLPGYIHAREGENVLFALNPIGESVFFHKIDKFWSLWSDCAITVCPDDEQIYLLETIPGMQFRSRVNHQGIQAAQKHFRNLIEAHFDGRLGDRVVEELLGQENAFPYFNRSLPVITESQLFDKSAHPIGHGANGAVYAASWMRPQGAFVTLDRSTTQTSVVLKEISPVARDGNTLQRLLRELNLTYLALTERSEGCIGFLGVTSISRPANELAPPSDVDRRILLVFERAENGNLFEYLCRVLPGLSFFEAWDRCLGVIKNVALGLYSLHRLKVIHRDLHPNNILVVNRTPILANDAGLRKDFAVIADIGEGKSLSSRTVEPVPGASYGCAEFRPPEVHGVLGWTPAADIFSFGVLCCKIVEARATLCTAAAPEALRQRIPPNVREGEELMPQGVTNMIRGCLRLDPAERPDAQKLVWDLDDQADGIWLTDNGTAISEPDLEEPDEWMEKIEWCGLDWRQTLAIARGAGNSKTSGKFSTGDSILAED